MGSLYFCSYENSVKLFLLIAEKFPNHMQINRNYGGRDVPSVFVEFVFLNLEPLTVPFWGDTPNMGRIGIQYPEFVIAVEIQVGNEVIEVTTYLP